MTRKNVNKTADWLIVHRYLCIDANGVTKLTAGQPALAPAEIAIRLELKLPRAMFKRPMLSASVEIPQSAVTPMTIETSTVNGIADMIKNATGLTAHLRVIDPSEQMS